MVQFCPTVYAWDEIMRVRMDQLSWSDARQIPTPATAEDVADALAFALRYSGRKRAR